MKKKYLIGILLIGIVLLCVIGITLLNSRGVKVSTTTVIREDIEDIYTEEGIVKFGEEFQIISKISGSIKSVAVEENEWVSAGDIVLVIDDRDLTYQKELHESTLAGYEAQLDQSSINRIMATSPHEYLESIKHQMNSSQAQYQAAKNLHDGTKVLYESGGISKLEWEQVAADYYNSQSIYYDAKSRYEESQLFLESLVESGIEKETINSKFYQSENDQLKALIQVEKTNISQLEDQIADCVIKADYDGIISILPAKNISVIQTGQLLATINRSQEMIIEVDVLTSIEPYLKIGDPVILIQKLRNDEEKYFGTISEIYGFANKGTSALGLDEYRVKVKVRIDERQEIQLKSGYSMNVQFILYQEKDQLLIPSQAVFQIDRQDYVYVIESNTIVKRPIISNHKSSAWVSVQEGLLEGEAIIQNIDSEDIYEGERAYK